MSAPFKPPQSSYTPDLSGGEPNPGLISKTRQDLSAGLLEASFGILGETFAQDSGNPNAAAPYAKLGATISGALHDRWNKQEYENFQAQYTNSYQQAANAIQGNFQMQMASLSRGELLQPDGSITKIDPKSEGFLRTQDTIIRQTTQSIHKINDQFLQDAAKFSTNPYISNVAQNLMQSNAQMISEASGPTPGDESEAGLAKIENLRSESRLNDRLPQARGGEGSEKLDQRGDPRALFEKLGPDGFMEYLNGTPKGREWTAPYEKMAAAQERKDLLDADPNLEGNDDMIAMRMGDRQQAIQERAAGYYMKTVFPDVANQMEEISGPYERFFRKKVEAAEAPEITGYLTEEETKAHSDQINEQSLQELEQVIRKKGPKTIDAAIDEVVNKWLPKYLKTATSNDAGALAFRKEARKNLFNFLSDPENWSRVDIANQRYGRPRKGTLDKISAGVDAIREPGVSGLRSYRETGILK